ncbi:hypothetical protein [Flexithrix dorotheae]|uniref:hypothetical protein n=1 Tax=Flexithrix dorotheae TaxID=70993 RepID=UPI00037C3434|nr:hypothetical protein [Flexithrix dorotheae]
MKNVKIKERPRVCCIDLEPEVEKLLSDSGLNIYSGSLGKRIKVPNESKYDEHYILPNYEFPVNAHEYDIFIINLEDNEIIEYNEKDHIRENHYGKFEYKLLSYFPEKIFNPKPLGSFNLRKIFNKIKSRKHLIIVFTDENYEVEYEHIVISRDGAKRIGEKKHNIYSFADYVPLDQPLSGKEFIVENIKYDMKILLEKHIISCYYNQTFFQPTIRKDNSIFPDPNFKPLLKNLDNDIVSFIDLEENRDILYLPPIKNKGEFLKEFFSKIAPDIYPSLFPFSTTFLWRENEKYWLPNHGEFLKEKKKLENEHNIKIKTIENKIAQNKNKYLYLHELLTGTGDKLVDALIKFFKWLGFRNVINFDEENKMSNPLEEDIQIELENGEGLLIIECKGIGGTSTDSDCSQISKVKHRRCRDRNKFDVYALYIVNHQRYLPPLKRQNPPFSKDQMVDAENDERGLLSTWQLFNLFEDIENKILTKEEARNSLLSFGYIEFKPENLIFIDEPKEILKNGEVCIVNISNLELKIGDEIFVEKNKKFSKVKILEIQANDKTFQKVTTGEIGLKFNFPISNKSVLWKKKNR